MAETTYTVLDNAGVLIAEGLSYDDAAREVLGHDGQTWDIRSNASGRVAGTGWELWTGRAGQAMTLTDRYCDIYPRDAEIKLFDGVHYRACGHSGAMTILTDDEYTRVTADDPR